MRDDFCVTAAGVVAVEGLDDGSSVTSRVISSDTSLISNRNITRRIMRRAYS